MTEDLQLALCTCPDRESAERLAERMVDAGLAACVNLVPGLRSIYRWQGALCRDEEILLLIKTRAARAAELATLIAREHPYATPELIAVPIVAGLDRYLEWVKTCTATQG